MSETVKYVANGGQTYLPCQDNVNVPFAAYEKPEKPNPLLPELELNQDAIDKGYVLPSQKQHFLPGVTSEMMDWFWANMEKGYYLWAPGSHKKFTWVKTPVEYGMEASVHMISEACEPGAAVFGGEGVEIHRLALKDFFPFTTCLKHVICEGVFNDLGELVDSTVHMWEDVEGGCVHITATVQNSKVSAPPSFIIDILKKDTTLYKIIKDVSALGIPNLYVGGGSITQSVWNHLFSKPIVYGISDVDIVYFDTDLSQEKERMVLEQIVKTTKQNQYALDVKNEARVHLWYEEEFGFSIPAYTSTEEAISTWPSTATSIGVFFDQESKLQVFAPYGMYDLFSGIVRPNKAMISREVYEKKIEKWCSKWAELNVIGWQ